jgi:hypothetical protein
MLIHRRAAAHIFVPIVFNLLFFAVALSPVYLLGCRTRGLLAFGIALLSGLAGIAAGIRGLLNRIRALPDSGWWMVSTLLLTIPVIGLIVLA